MLIWVDGIGVLPRNLHHIPMGDAGSIVRTGSVSFRRLRHRTWRGYGGQVSTQAMLALRSTLLSQPNLNPLALFGLT